MSTAGSPSLLQFYLFGIIGVITCGQHSAECRGQLLVAKVCTQMRQTKRVCSNAETCQLCESI